jgi:hypothetical protein
VPRREENRVQLAASRACSKEEFGGQGRKGKDPVGPPDCGESGKQATITISHASLEAACGRSGQPRCFVVAVQPTTPAGHALGQAMTCTCLLCQHDNYLALQSGLSRASEQRLPTIDQRPANQTRSAFCHNRCAFCLYQPVASSLRGPFRHMVSRQPGASPVSLWVYLSISVAVCMSASVTVPACSKSAVKCPFNPQSLISDCMSRFPRRYNPVQVLALALALSSLAQRGTRILLSSLPASLEPSRPQD